MLQTNAEELKAGVTATTSSRFGHDFSRIPIHPSAVAPIQMKLAINKPGDEYEQQADRVSKRVMRMPELRLQHACACGGNCPKVPKPEKATKRQHGALTNQARRSCKPLP